jgi:hypothetical protein
MRDIEHWAKIGAAALTRPEPAPMCVGDVLYDHDWTPMEAAKAVLEAVDHQGAVEALHAARNYIGTRAAEGDEVAARALEGVDRYLRGPVGMPNIERGDRLWLLHLPNGDTITRHAEPTTEMRAAEDVVIVEYVLVERLRGAVEALRMLADLHHRTSVAALHYPEHRDWSACDRQSCQLAQAIVGGK